MTATTRRRRGIKKPEHKPTEKDIVLEYIKNGLEKIDGIHEGSIETWGTNGIYRVYFSIKSDRRPKLALKTYYDYAQHEFFIKTIDGEINLLRKCGPNYAGPPDSIEGAKRMYAKLLNNLDELLNSLSR